MFFGHAAPRRETAAEKNLPAPSFASGVVEAGKAPPPARSLAEAYEYCRRVNAHYGKTYYFSTRFIPQELRPAVHALYAWVRYPDEWVDNPQGLTLEQQKQNLCAWREETAKAIETGQSAHPVLFAWGDAARRYDVSLSYMSDFVGAMEMDLTVSRYETFADLQKYTWGSASVVGLMMCRILGAIDERAVPHAADLGLAMQMTNFLRDVGEDWRERGRIYLPMEDLARFSVSEDDIAEGRKTDAFCQLAQWQIERTRALYQSADEGFRYIPKEARLPVRLARVLYSRILNKIEQNACDVFTRRARVPFLEKVGVLAEESLRHRRA